MTRSAVLSPIIDRTSHDAAVELAQSGQHAVVIYVTNPSSRICATLTPKVEALAATYQNEPEKEGGGVEEGDGGVVRWFVMEMAAPVTPMIKFGPQNAPLFILMSKGGKTCETVLGPDLKSLETKVNAIV